MSVDPPYCLVFPLICCCFWLIGLRNIEVFDSFLTWLSLGIIGEARGPESALIGTALHPALECGVPLLGWALMCWVVLGATWGHTAAWGHGV